MRPSVILVELVETILLDNLKPAIRQMSFDNDVNASVLHELL